MAAQSDLRFLFEASDRRLFDAVRSHRASFEPFHLELELSPDPDSELDALRVPVATFTIGRKSEPMRTVHGIVPTFEQREAGFQHTRSRVVLEAPPARPWHGSRIHQQVAAPEILSSRLNKHGLTASFSVSRAPAFENGAVLEGTLDDKGHALIENAPPFAYKLELGEDPRHWTPDEEPAPEHKQESIQDKARAQIEREMESLRSNGQTRKPRSYYREDL